MANNSTHEYDQLKKRNRRRLIGTVILVFIVSIILWKAFSQKPPQSETNKKVLIVNDTSNTTTLPPLDVVDPIISDTDLIDLSGAEEIASGESVTQSSAPTLPISPQIDQAVTQPQITPQPPETNTKKPEVTKKKTETVPKTEGKQKKPEQPKTQTKVQPKNPTQPPKHKYDPKDILEGRVPGMTAPEKSSSGKYVIQVAALTNETQAKELKKRLDGMGIKSSISSANTSKGQVNRVRVGPFSDKTEAEKTLNRLESSNLGGIIVHQ